MFPILVQLIILPGLLWQTLSRHEGKSVAHRVEEFDDAGDRCGRTQTVTHLGEGSDNGHASCAHEDVDECSGLGLAGHCVRSLLGKEILGQQIDERSVD